MAHQRVLVIGIFFSRQMCICIFCVYIFFFLKYQICWDSPQPAMLHRLLLVRWHSKEKWKNKCPIPHENITTFFNIHGFVEAWPHSARVLHNFKCSNGQGLVSSPQQTSTLGSHYSRQCPLLFQIVFPSPPVPSCLTNVSAEVEKDNWTFCFLNLNA